MRSMFGKQIVVAAALLSMWALPIATSAQTRIVMPKNKYKVQDDIKLGNDAARKVDQQFPILNDDDATRYIESVGNRLVDAIPREFQQPAFNYRFKLVNASDINAFALPGGPMFVNRGMIEAAKNEGEMAGVMAHEISHVALRHATAQATKQGSVGNQLGMIGLILGGAVLGGQTGAELGAAAAQTWMTKYSREYETQADVLGARIMANAGYDPRDLANMFKTIASEGGSRTPQWMSDHPDPGNRYNNINREAGLLQVSSNPIKLTRDFERIKARLRAMPAARTMAEIERSGGGQGNTTSPAAGGRYGNNVPYPSSRVRQYSNGGISLSIPSNWQQFPGSNDVQFAPEGAYGDQGITRGAMVGVLQAQNATLQQATQEYVNGLMQSNNYLSQRNGYGRTYIDGREGFSTMLSGRSPVTNRVENVTVYTTQMDSGGLFYVITVVPNDESSAYASSFRTLISSIRLNN
ncbi:MAG: M48 family metallopeptidase [Acidobacteriota bacterium]